MSIRRATNRKNVPTISAKPEVSASAVVPAHSTPPVANNAGKDISVCGEMAHDMRYVPFFVGIGVRKLSVDPSFLPDVQDGLFKMTAGSCETYANRLTRAATLRQTGKIVNDGP